MTQVPAVAPGVAAATAAKRAELRKTAVQLEGMFARQLFSAMRATVPTGEGVIDGGAGEEMFRGMFDEHLADEMPKHWQRDLTEKMVTQLAGNPVAPSTTGSR